MHRRGLLYSLVAVFCVGILGFIALTILVSSGRSVALDLRAVEIANQLREPWLDHVARAVTQLGLFVIVGPVLLIGPAVLVRRRGAVRAAALIAGAVLTSIAVWTTKAAVDRARPPVPLVHTAGQSYPSAHAANAVGWLALAMALTIGIPTRVGRSAAIAAGGLLAALVGLSRIYLRVHYASDVLAGEALGAAMYALSSLGALAWERRHPTREQIAGPPTRAA